MPEEEEVEEMKLILGIVVFTRLFAVLQMHVGLWFQNSLMTFWRLVKTQVYLHQSLKSEFKYFDEYTNFLTIKLPEIMSDDKIFL